MFLRFWNIKNEEIQKILPSRLRNKTSFEACKEANEWLKENTKELEKAVLIIEKELENLDSFIKTDLELLEKVDFIIGLSQEDKNKLYISKWVENFLINITNKEPERLSIKQKSILLGIAENINRNIWKIGLDEVKKNKTEKVTTEEIDEIFINDESEIMDEFDILYDNFDDVMETRLFDHQVKTVNFLLTRENKNGIIASDTGMGKTIIAMAYAEKLNQNTVIICPLAMTETWKKEILKHSLKKDLSKYKIINYEKILKDDFENVENTLLILDEAHKIKNIKAKRTEILMKYNWKNVVCLTATPYGNDANDLRSLFKITGYKSPITLEGTVNIEYLKKAMIRIKKDKLNLKPMHIITVPLVMENITEYRDIEKNIKDEIKEETSYNIILTKMMRLLQYCSDRNMIMKNKTEFKESIKFKALLELIDKHEEKQILIWENSIETIENLKKELSEYTSCECIYGDIKQCERNKILDDFRNGEIKLLVANPRTLSAGITLVNTNIHIFYGRDFSIIERLQALGRSYRIGQDKEVYIYDLYYKGTIEEYVIEKLENKEKNLSDVLNGCMQLKEDKPKIKEYFENQ